MTRFNIIGRGFLDIEAGNAAGFTKTNPWFRFADVELGRSVEFNVPATTHNCAVLEFGDDPSEYGEMMRTNHTCQLVYDGGQIMGTLAVNAYANRQFSCVFLIGGSSWIDDLQDKKLSECISDLYILWQHGTTPTDASSADPSLGVELLKYENGLAVADPDWCVAPSVNVRYFINEILTNLGIPHNIAVESLLYMVAGSLQNGREDAVAFTQLDSTDVDIAQYAMFFEKVSIDVEWATALVFAQYIGGGSHTIDAFRATHDLKLTFDTVPADIFFIKWNLNLKNCQCVGGYPSDLTGIDEYWRNRFHDLSNTTIELKKGEIFFFADYFGFVQSTDLWKSSRILSQGYFGWQDNAHGVTILTNASADVGLNSGENWWMRYNMPEMTVFEFLKSVCLATGMELTVDPVDGITIDDGTYGIEKLEHFKPLERVLSVERVARTAWGENTAAVVVDFDSDEYVTQTLSTEYGIPNEVNTERKGHKSKFSEGDVGDKGILIKDVEPASYNFKAKKWTLAYADPNIPFLQRIYSPVAVGYHDIAANSTAVTVKALLPLADFFAMKPSTTWLWRGCAYLWQKASWSDGVLTMEMQRVSARRQEIVIPYIISIEAVLSQPATPIAGTDSLDDLKQWLTVTATYSNGTTRVLSASEYTLNGVLAYPSATVTADADGVTDTFTVAVAYDAEVEFLEKSHTGPYINLGLTPTREVVTMVFQWLGHDYSFLFGSRVSSVSKKFNIGIGSDMKIYAVLGDAINVRLSDANDHNEHIVVLNSTNNTASIDGGEDVYVGNFQSSSLVMYVFACNVNGTITQSPNMRLMALRLGTRMDLIPVRCGTVGYMFDTVSGQLFGNAGTGDFIVGPDVP